ncbi:MAG: hypothetical protein AAB276_00845, partial [Pseudomonadota bacterium]
MKLISIADYETWRSLARAINERINDIPFAVDSYDRRDQDHISRNVDTPKPETPAQRMEKWVVQHVLAKNDDSCGGGAGAGLIRLIYAQGGVCITLAAETYVPTADYDGEPQGQQKLPLSGYYVVGKPGAPARDLEKVTADFENEFAAGTSMRGISANSFVKVFNAKGEFVTVVDVPTLMRQMEQGILPAFDAGPVYTAVAGVRGDKNKDTTTPFTPFDAPLGQRMMAGQDAVFVLPNGIIISLDGISAADAKEKQRITDAVNLMITQIAQEMKNFNPDVVNPALLLSAFQNKVQQSVDKIKADPKSVNATVMVTMFNKDAEGNVQKLDYRIGDHYEHVLTDQADLEGVANPISLTIEKAHVVLAATGHTKEDVEAYMRDS